MKSKIEEKIEKAREATNEMFAALDELNERLSERICEIRLPNSWDIVIREKMEEQRKWVPGRGEYATIKYNYNGEIQQYICIVKDKLDKTHYPYAVIDTTGKLHIGRGFIFDKGDVACPSNQQERQLLDDKLKESGKRFDKEKCELVDIPKFKVGDWFIPHKPKQNKTNIFWVEEMDKFDGVALQVSKPIFKGAEGLYSEVADWHFHPDWCEKTTAPKHKEPIIGEMAIFWDSDKCSACVRIFVSKRCGRPVDHIGCSWNNAILFESAEQFKAFIKEK